MKISHKLNQNEHIDKTFDKAAVTIGRSVLKCDFAVEDETLSRQHCLIESENGNFFVTDLGSSNGVFIDGERIAPHTRLSYTPVLPLVIGRYECQLTLDKGTRSLVNVLPLFEKENKRFREKNQSKKPQPLARLKKPISLNRNILLLLVLVMAGGLWWFSLDQEEEVFTASSPVIRLKTRPKKPPEPVPSLMTVTNYLRLFVRRNCNDDAAVFCNKLHLQLDRGEGIYKEPKRLIIFMVPSYHLKEPDYTGLSGRFKKENLVALHRLLKSEITEDVISGKTDELYLVLMNAVGALKTIHSFKKGAAFSRAEVLGNLERTLKTPGEENFLEAHSAVFPEFPIGGGFR